MRFIVSVASQFADVVVHILGGFQVGLGCKTDTSFEIPRVLFLRVMSPWHVAMSNAYKYPFQLSR